MMVLRTLKFAILAYLCGIGTAMAQNTCGNTKLACLLPTALHTNPPTFNFFNQTFATQITQLPLATPASGFIYTFDKQKGINVASQESFGPLLAERMETIGKDKLYVAFVYQRFSFDELDGNSLGTLPLVFNFPTLQNPLVITQTVNRIDTSVNQYVGFATYGLTRKVDVSIAVPFDRIAMGVSSSGTEYSTTSSATASFTEFTPGAASGFGDVVLAGKGTLWTNEKYGVAAGMELRLPSGDEQNFLGSGTVGLKPYVVLARRGKVAPHLNLIYQWNSSSPLTKDANGQPQPLPRFFGYTIGVDTGLLKRVTFAVDLVGQHFFNAPRITKPSTFTANVNNTVPQKFSSVSSFNGDYEVDNLAVGLKANPWKQLLILGNATIKLNDGGMRATVIPMVGASYSF